MPESETTSEHLPDKRSRQCLKYSRRNRLDLNMVAGLTRRSRAGRRDTSTWMLRTRKGFMSVSTRKANTTEVHQRVCSRPGGLQREGIQGEQEGSGLADMQCNSSDR